MTEKIQLAVDEIQAVMLTVDGIRKAPSNPTGNVGDMWSLCYPSRGTNSPASAGFSESTHQLTVDILTDIDSMERAYRQLTPYVDTVPTAIRKAMEDGDFSTIGNIGTIQHTIGSIMWNGVQRYSARFVIDNVHYSLIH